MMNCVPAGVTCLGIQNMTELIPVARFYFENLIAWVKRGSFGRRLALTTLLGILASALLAIAVFFLCFFGILFAVAVTAGITLCTGFLALSFFVLSASVTVVLGFSSCAAFGIALATSFFCTLILFASGAVALSWIFWKMLQRLVIFWHCLEGSLQMNKRKSANGTSHLSVASSNGKINVQSTEKGSDNFHPSFFKKGS